MHVTISLKSASLIVTSDIMHLNYRKMFLLEIQLQDLTYFSSFSNMKCRMPKKLYIMHRLPFYVKCRIIHKKKWNSGIPTTLILQPYVPTLLSGSKEGT